MNCSGHCSHLHLQCTKIETLVPHGILAPSSRFRKALTQTALGNELQCPERGGSASTELGSSFWMNYPNQLSHGSLEEQLSFSQDFPSVTALLQRSLAVIKGFSGLLHKQFSSIKFVHMSLLHMYKPRHTCSWWINPPTRKMIFTHFSRKRLLFPLSFAEIEITI